MNSARVSRKAHTWLALVAGIQLVIWMLSGFYMVVVDLDFIHGDSLVRNLEPRLALDRPIVSLDGLRARYPDLRSVTLRGTADGSGPVYEIETAAGLAVVDATSGDQLSPFPEERIVGLARAYYAGSGRVVRATLLSDDSSKPIELQSRPLPLWRVDFDDWLETSLYLHPETGRLVTRRHRFWRWFDFLWSLHIMDYTERSDVNNGLLRVATVAGVVATGTGIWLAFHSFAFLQRRRRAGSPRALPLAGSTGGPP